MRPLAVVGSLFAMVACVRSVRSRLVHTRTDITGYEVDATRSIALARSGASSTEVCVASESGGGTGDGAAC
jgi:hypothetical protein